MAIRKKLPLPQALWRSTSEESVPDILGTRLVDIYIDELKVWRKRPGLELFLDLGVTDALDGLFWWREQNKLIAVAGGNIYAVNQDTSFTDITGDGLTSGVPVIFATDGTLLVMANGGRMVTWSGVGTTSFMADAQAPTTVDHVFFLDTYLIANTVDTAIWNFSDAGDITAWAALDFESAGTQPDKILAAHTRWRELQFFGEDTLEIWRNDGVNPFSRIDGAFTQRGCGAKYSIQYAGGNANTFIWMDDERRINILKGRQPLIISPPLEDVFRDFVTVSDAVSMLINIGNRIFYILNFPSESKTIVYDLSTQRFYEWGEWDSSVGDWDIFKCSTHSYAKTWNIHFCGDNSTGKIYKMSNDLTDDVGSDMRSVIRTAPITHGTLQRKRTPFVEVRMKRSQGNGGSAPKVMVRVKDDNKDWSPEIEMSLGEIGETETILRLNKMGSYKTRQWEFIHSDNSEFQLIEVEEMVEGLTE